MRPIPHLRALSCAVLLGLGASLCVAAVHAADVERLRPLDVVINGSKSGTWLLLERAGVLYATRDIFDEWRVQLDAKAAFITYKGEKYWPLSSVPGYQAKLNTADQTLDLLFSPNVFSATRLTQETVKKPVLSPVLPSAFLNYDFNYARSALRNAPSIQDLGMLGELGFSNGWGVLTNSFSSRNLTKDTALGIPSRTVRLESTFTRDFPEQNRTFRLGDGVTRAGMLGRSVYFGGVQYGTNFALSPGFVTQPLPVLTGLSAAPSTVELYVNDVLRQVSKVPTGPFALDNLPTLTGNGDARLVVRDQLGRETIITQSFFTSGKLLAAGLTDWSVEAGSVRSDLGLSNGRYGPSFISSTWRQGVTPRVTLEGRAELTRDLQNIQFGTIAGLPLQLLGIAALASSHQSQLGRGNQWLLGLEHQTLFSSTYLQAQGASERFRQLGEIVSVKPTKLQMAANWTYSLEQLGTIGLGYAAITPYDKPRVATLSGSYATRFGEQTMLSVTANHVQGSVQANSVGLNLLVLLDKNRTASLVTNHRAGSTDAYATVAQSPLNDIPLGWRVLAGRQQNQTREEVGVNYQGLRGVAKADVSHTPNQTATRFGVNGGLVFADGHLFATPRVLDSFAVAEIANYGNIGIGLGSNITTRTDSKGIALVPRLSPYQNNQVRINPAELPINAAIDSIEQTVVPAWRSAVKVTFPVHSGRGAMVKVVLEDADVVPAGATIAVEGDKEIFYVARRGEAFLTGLKEKNRVTLSWKNQQCEFEVALPPPVEDEFPRVGPLRCIGVKR